MKTSQYHTFLGAKHLFFKGEDRIFKGKQFFIRRIPFLIRSGFFWREGGGAQIFEENLFDPKVDRAPGFSSSGF